MPALARSRLVLRFLLLFALAPLAGPAQAPKPVPGQPYQFWDVVDVDGGARRVYFRNDSPNPITITELVIQRCDNTRQTCGSYPAKVVVAPGKTVMPFKIERLDRALAWQFSYSFHVAGQPTTVPANPTPTPTMGRNSPIALQVTTIDSLLPAVAPISEGPSCAKVRTPDLPPGHHELSMVFGTATQPAARRVRVLLDGNGSPYDFSDIRQDLADTTSTPRQTQITIDLVRQTVFLLNSGGGEPSAAFRATGATLLTAESLGKPGETIARMVKECGGN